MSSGELMLRMYPLRPGLKGRYFSLEALNSELLMDIHVSLTGLFKVYKLLKPLGKSVTTINYKMAIRIIV
jgi:hypothetical protein